MAGQPTLTGTRATTAANAASPRRQAPRDAVSSWHGITA